MSREGLRQALRAMGVVGVIAGVSGMTRGPAEVQQAGSFTAKVDSEYRLYATWYAVSGLLLVRAARRPESETALIRAYSTGLFAAGCARVISILRVGRPNSLQKVLMAAEFVIPLVVVPWQARVASTTHNTPS